MEFSSPCSPRDTQKSSPTPQFKSINSSALSFLYSPPITSIHDYWINSSICSDYCPLQTRNTDSPPEMHRSLFWEPLLLQAFLCFCGSPTPRFAGSSEFDQDKMHQPRSTLTGGRCGCGLIRHYCQFGPPETRIFIKSCCMQFLSEEKTA